MANEPQTDYGVLQFLPYHTFGPDRDLRRYDWREPVPPGTFTGWPRVHTAIRRGGVFVIEASSPDFSRIELRFCPEKPDVGKYEIHRGRYEEVERGHSVRLKEVPVDETDGRVAMLSAFQVRYFIVTEPDTPRWRRLVWLVGLREFRAVEEGEAIEDNDAV